MKATKVRPLVTPECKGVDSKICEAIRREKRMCDVSTVKLRPNKGGKMVAPMAMELRKLKETKGSVRVLGEKKQK